MSIGVIPNEPSWVDSPKVHEVGSEKHSWVGKNAKGNPSTRSIFSADAWPLQVNDTWCWCKPDNSTLHFEFPSGPVQYFGFNGKDKAVFIMRSDEIMKTAREFWCSQSEFDQLMIKNVGAVPDIFEAIKNKGLAVINEVQLMPLFKLKELNFLNAKQHDGTIVPSELFARYGFSFWSEGEIPVAPGIWPISPEFPGQQGESRCYSW